MCSDRCQAYFQAAALPRRVADARFFPCRCEKLRKLRSDQWAKQAPSLSSDRQNHHPLHLPYLRLSAPSPSMYTERKNAHLAGPKPEALHPTLQALLQKYLTMELPPLPPLSGPIANTWRSHTSYKGVRHQTHEEPEGSKANDYERME